MGQQEIADLLEKYPNEWFEARRIANMLNIATKQNITQSCNRLVKREGFESRMLSGTGPFGVRLQFRYVEEIK